MLVGLFAHPGLRGVMFASFTLALFDSQSLAGDGLSAKKPDREIRVRMRAVEFTSDHNLLHRDGADLLSCGERYSDVEWESSRKNETARISHTAARYLQARALVSLSHLPAGTMVRLIGESDNEPLAIQGKARIEETGGEPAKAIVNLVAKTLLPATLTAIRGEIHWFAEVEIPGESPRMVDVGDNVQVECFLTRGTPRRPTAPASEVTAMRLRASYQHLSDALESAPENPSVIAMVHALTRYCGRFYNPQQHFEREDAWHVPVTWGYRYRGASCISICNFCSLIIDQLGIEGDYRQIEIYAHPSAPTKAVEGGVTSEDFVKDVGWQRWQLFLVDDRNTRFGQVGGYGGMNHYEACIAFTYAGKTYYFPGGTDRVYDDMDTVLRVFRTLVWARWDSWRNEWQVMQVVYTYTPPGRGAPSSCELP